ncbi:hypothetical protein [Nannocystis pusilla]|uniref:hypothetical protein n=1 Tax=Nannocystis pusilla TaxID=889268 RepID=UPI003B788487
MRLSLERFGFGGGLHDPDAGDATTAGRVRRLAWWMLLEACGERRLALVVEAAFRRPDGPPNGPEATMVRLLAQLDRLVTIELPRLVRAVRVETTQRSEAMWAPRGGRVDALATVRASPATPPKAWMVRRVERRVETPVNLFAAAIVRAATEHVRGVGELYLRWRLAPPELVVGAGVALHRFLRDHPLGRLELSPSDDPERHRGAAARRGIEFARISSLIDWWDNLRDTDLTALHEVGQDGAFSEISAGAAYELAVAMGLLCALGLRLAWAPTPDATDWLRFVGRRGSVVVRLGVADRYGISRRMTATLERSGAGKPTTWLIEARLCRSAEVGPHWAYLGARALQAGGGTRALLITPDAVAAPWTSQVRCAAFPSGSDAPALVQGWQALLDDEGAIAAIE